MARGEPRGTRIARIWAWAFRETQREQGKFKVARRAPFSYEEMIFQRRIDHRFGWLERLTVNLMRDRAWKGWRGGREERRRRWITEETADAEGQLEAAIALDQADAEKIAKDRLRLLRRMAPVVERAEDREGPNS